MQPETGAVIGEHYTLLRRLTASSWLARTTDDSEYVLKFHAAAPAELPAGVAHPALIRSEHLDDDTTVRPYLAGWVAGDAEPMARRDALVAARRLAEALAALHAAGGVHGNIKPSNIIFRQGALPVVVDATGRGQPSDDVSALASSIHGWLSEAGVSPRLKSVLQRAAAGELGAAHLQEALEDEYLVLSRGPGGEREAPVVVSSDEPVGDAPGREVSPRLISLAALALAAIALIAALLLLPDPPEEQAAPAPTTQEPAAEPEPEPERELTAAELETLLEQRKSAQAVLDRVINLQLELVEQSVDRWAPEAFDRAAARAEQGDEPFRQQRYEAAGTIYGEALEQLQAISDRGQEVVAENLERGAQALADGDSSTAAAAFDLVLAVEPDNKVASAGAGRAETLDQALALRTAALEAEAAGHLQQAQEQFEQLLRLDPAMPGVQASIDRVQAAIVDRRFRQAMSDGLAALEIRDWGNARAAFQRAQRIRPGDSAPAGYLTEVEDRARRNIIESHRDKAQQAVTDERWAQALAHYDAVLKREPQAKFAQEGRALATRRLQLDEQLEHFVSSPEEWWSESGRQRARALLSRARSIGQQGPRLERQIRSLTEQIELASEPVNVLLVSDNSCNVVVYKVARLGTFDRRQIDLKPGRYTAVGTRDGYRDVRKDFLVPAGEDPAPVELRCEEPV